MLKIKARLTNLIIKLLPFLVSFLVVAHTAHADDSIMYKFAD